MNEEVRQNPITAETCFVPKTHEGRGRRTAVSPGRTASRYLHYGRITLDAGDAPVRFNSKNHEVGLIASIEFYVYTDVVFAGDGISAGYIPAQGSDILRVRSAVT